MEGTPDLIGLMSKLPSQGNTALDSQSNPDASSGAGDLTAEQKLAAAEKLIQEQKVKEAAAAAATASGNQDPDDGEDQPSDEEIQAKLDELGKKEEAQLTDEDKQFIEKYTQSQVDEITSIKNDFEQTYGIKLDEKYDNGPEGLKKLTNDLVPKLAEATFIESLNTIPFMKEFYQHVTSGKSIETFLAKNTKPEFETIELKDISDTDDDVTKDKILGNSRKLIEMNFKTKGLSDADIKIFMDLYEAKGDIVAKGKEAKQELSVKHKAEIEAQLKAEEQRIQAEEKQAQEVAKQARELVKKGQLSGYSIPTTDVPMFEKALFDVDQKGFSLLDYKRSKLTLEQRLFIDYIVLKDFKNVNFAVKAGNNKTFSFSKASKENNERGGSRLAGAGGGSQRGGGFPSIDIKQIDFSQINKK